MLIFKNEFALLGVSAAVLFPTKLDCIKKGKCSYVWVFLDSQRLNQEILSENGSTLELSNSLLPSFHIDVSWHLFLQCFRIQVTSNVQCKLGEATVNMEGLFRYKEQARSFNGSFPELKKCKILVEDYGGF